MVNAAMVNFRFERLKLPGFEPKLPGKNVFSAFKTTVKYNRRFDLNYKIAPLSQIFPMQINHIPPRIGPEKLFYGNKSLSRLALKVPQMGMK